MSLLLMDGFELYMNGTDDIPSSIDNFGPWNIDGVSSRVSVSTARFANVHSILLDERGPAIAIETKENIFFNGTTHIMGFAFRFTRTSTAAKAIVDPVIFTLPNSNLNLSFADPTLNDAQIILNGVPVPDYRYTYGNWIYIELKWTQNDDTTVELKINNVTVLTLNNVNVGANNDILRFGGASDSPYDHTSQFDDLYILDDTGPSLNDFLGPRLIEKIGANAVGDSSDFTANVNTTWGAINQGLIIGGNSRFLQSNTLGDKSLFNNEDLSVVQSNILAVRVYTRQRVNSFESYDIDILFKENSVETAVHSLTVDYNVFNSEEFFVFTDPSGNPWTTSSINNLQIGLEVKAIN